MKIIEKYRVEIPKENLIINKNNKKWQEIRRASNIFASLVLNSNELVDGENDELATEIEKLYLSSNSIALIVNISFSIELAFKAILEYQGILIKPRHELDYLFSLLNPRTRKLIVRYLNISRCFLYDKYNSEQELIEALKPINGLYIKYRYFFDEKYDLKIFNKDLMVFNI